MSQLPSTVLGTAVNTKEPWPPRSLLTSWRLKLFVYKQPEEDLRKDSLPDKKVILGVMMGPEGGEQLERG